MTIDLIFITYNRLEYTKLALPALLVDPTEEFSLTIWDNGSTDGTREYLSSVEDPRITRKVLLKENLGLKGAVNDFFSKCSGDLLGIIPDDILVPPGWTRTLATAHADVPEFGIVGCWHLGAKDFNYGRAKHKIQRFGRHQILRHPYTGGAAGLFKRRTVKEFGLLEANVTPHYWMRMAKAGYVNGFYYPLVCVEHMDYPWSKYFAYSDRFEEWVNQSSGAKRHGICTIQDARAWHRVVVNHILDDPWQVKYYVGWRGKLRNSIQRVRNILRIQTF